MYFAVELFRGIASFMVMTGHYWRFLSENPNYFIFTETGVILFFVISGFVFGKSINNNISLLPYFTKRFFRIYPLYILSLMIYYYFTSPAPLKNTVLLKHIFFLHTTNTVEEAYFFNGPYWTLPVEVEFYAAVPLLSFFQKINKHIILCLIPLFMLIGFYLNINSTFPRTLNIYAILSFHLPGLFFEFLIGILCYQVYQQYQKKIKQQFLILTTLSGIVILGSLFIIDVYELRNSLLIGRILYAPACAIGYAFIIFSSLFLIIDKNSMVAKLCVFCGQVSYGTYLFHMLIPKIINLLGYSLTGIRAYFLCTFSVILISYIMYLFFENPMRIFGRRLSLKVSRSPQGLVT